jgi:catechol-2,3-dioxygenase
MNTTAAGPTDPGPTADASRPTSAAPAPRKLAHFVMRTPRYQEMVAWYSTVLQAHVVFGSPLLCFLTYDDEHHRIAFLNQPQLEDADPAAAGVDHIAFTYATLADLVATYERLAGEGIHPHWCINHGPTTSMYYRDPDGGQVELQIDNFATAEELDAWFATGAFAENPIGVEFDPELLAERLRAGVPVDELIRQGSTKVA